MSIVIAVATVSAVAGPVVPDWSAAPFAANRGRTVPFVQPVIETVRVSPESVPGSKIQLIDVPAFEKSAPVTPVTGSENVKV